MAHDSHRTYFENRILTASPEKLHYILLSSALQATKKADQLFTVGSAISAGVELAHAEAILADMIGRMRKEIAPDLVEKTTAMYAFILRRLTDAHADGDVRGLHDAIRVLEVEHETWRLVCERSTEAVASTPAPHASFDSDATSYSGGLTLEA